MSRVRALVASIGMLAIGLVALPAEVLAAPQGQGSPQSKGAKKPAKPRAAPAPAPAKPVAPKPAQPRPQALARPEPAPLAPMPDVATVHARAPSGLGVVVVPVAGAPQVSMVTAIAAGRWREPPRHGGLADAQGLAMRDALLERARRGRTGFDLEVEVNSDAILVVTEGAREELLDMLDAHLGLLASPPVPGAPSRARAAEALAQRVSAQDHLESLVFQGYAPYAATSSERSTRLRALDEASAAQFTAQHVRAPGAVVAIVGDVDAAALIERVQRFELPAAEPSPAPPDKLEEQTNQRFAELHADQRSLRYGWALRGATDRDAAGVILGLELAARRIERAGRGDPRRAVRRAQAVVDLRHGPSLATLHVEPGEGAEIGRVRATVEEALSALGKEQLRGAELEEARRASVIGALSRRSDRSALATALARDELRPPTSRLRIEALLPGLDPSDLRSAAARHLGPLTRSLVVEQAPAGAPKR